MDELIAEIDKIKKLGFRVITYPGMYSKVDECRFASEAYAEQNDETPICQTCKKPLSFVFQFHDKPNKRLLVFYYCFHCLPIGAESENKSGWLIKAYKNPSESKFKEGIGIDKKLKPCNCSVRECFTAPDYEIIEAKFPKIAKICKRIDPKDPESVYRDAADAASCMPPALTIIGGYPCWVQGETEKTCKCGKKMQFIAQIESEPDANLMWGDLGSVYIFCCPKHINEFAIEMQCY